MSAGSGWSLFSGTPALWGPNRQMCFPKNKQTPGSDPCFLVSRPGLPGSSQVLPAGGRGPWLQQGWGPPDWTGHLGLTLQGFPAQISGTGARHWHGRTLRSPVVFTALVWGLQGQGMRMMCLCEGAVRRGWAWPSCLSPAHGFQGLWGITSRYLLLVPRPPASTLSPVPAYPVSWGEGGF